MLPALHNGVDTVEIRAKPFGAERIMPDYKSYIICTYLRSGGSLLYNLLAVNRQIITHFGLDHDAASGVSPSVAKLAEKTSHDWANRFGSEVSIVDGP